MYRTDAHSLPGFIQQLAVSYVGNGYFFYVLGRVPDGKDPRAVDAKLVARYGIDVSKWARAAASRPAGRTCTTSASAECSSCSRRTGSTRSLPRRGTGSGTSGGCR